MTARPTYRGIQMPVGSDPRVYLPGTLDGDEVAAVAEGIGNWMNGVDAALDTPAIRGMMAASGRTANTPSMSVSGGDDDPLGNVVRAIWSGALDEFLKDDDGAPEEPEYRYYRSGNAIRRYRVGESRPGEMIYANDREDVWEEIGGVTESEIKRLGIYEQVDYADLPDHAKES